MKKNLTEHISNPLKYLFCFRTWLLFIWIIAICPTLQAEQITLKNGSIISGKIKLESSDHIEVHVDSGVITLPRDKIVHISNEPQASRNAFSLDKYHIKKSQIGPVAGLISGMAVLILLFKPFFGDSTEFWTCFKYSFKPNWLSLFQGRDEYLTDVWSEFKLQAWILLGFIAGGACFFGVEYLLTR